MCLFTRYILNPKYLPSKKNGYNPPELKDNRLKYVPVSCGGCIECRKAKKREWNIRLSEELKRNSQVLFVTLTFNKESMEEIAEKLGHNVKHLNYEQENQICKYASRHFMELIRKHRKKYPKYWLITEKGEDFGRIHMHGLIWADYNPLEYWKYGYTYKGDYVNERTINYVCKYILKAPEKYKTFVGKIFASKGIGKGYWKSYNAKNNKFQENGTDETYRLENGAKVALPQYYRNYIYSDAEKEKLWIQKQERGYRYIGGEKVMADDEETWTNLTRYYQRVNKDTYKFDFKEWEASEQARKREKMRANLKRFQQKKR